MIGWLNAFKNLRFRHKLILTYAIVSLIPLLALGLYSFNQSSSFLHKQAEQAFKETVGTMAERLNAKLEWYDGIVQSVVSNSGFHKIFSNQYTDLTVMSEDVHDYLEPYFDTVLYLNKEIEQMTVFSEGMPEVGEYMIDAARVRDEKWFESAISSNRTEWVFDSQALVAARMFPDIYVNENTAVLYLRLDPNQLLNEIGKSNLSQYGVVLYDDRLQILFSNRDAADLNGSLSPEDAVKSDDGIAIADNVPYIVIRRPLPLPGLTLLCYVPVGSVSENAGSIVQAMIVIILVCLIILFALVWIFSHTILKPLRHLNKKMMQVEDGNLQISVNSRARDEIGELTNRFGRMLGRINELIREMYQNKIVQKEAEMKALQSQINPHFLYNSLSIINWKAVQLGADDIGRIVTSLSRFYRTALNKGSNVIAVRDEIANVISYLDIQLIMHDYSFDVDYAIDDGIYEFDMIHLVLQPIVENAIEHGIDLKTDGRGLLAIRGAADGDEIVITIEDNGPGIEPDVRKQLLTAQTEGYGLKNVQERIRLFFGEPYGIEIESEAGAGTRMRVRFPKFNRGRTG